MTKVRREQEIEFFCPDDHEDIWFVEGRFNADGKFEPTDDDDTICAECQEQGLPTDLDIEVA